MVLNLELGIIEGRSIKGGELGGYNDEVSGGRILARQPVV